MSSPQPAAANALQIVPVIMCGGAGTRLWPVSRESMPKQFVSLVGTQSTFQQVLDRISDPTLFGRPIIITNAEFRFVVAEQLRATFTSGETLCAADSGRLLVLAASSRQLPLDVVAHHHRTGLSRTTAPASSP